MTLYRLNWNGVMEKQFPRASAEAYDALRFISSVQGLRNRSFPELFVDWRPDTDVFWLDYITSPGKFLHGADIRDIDTFEQFLEIYSGFIRERGLIEWDYTVPATSNVAATICGAEGLLPVRAHPSPDSVAGIVTARTGAQVKQSLTGMFTGKGVIPGTDRQSSGSSKCDAYIWAMDKYLDSTNPELMFFMLDGISWRDGETYYPDLGNAFIPNHDYAVMKKGFVFDLSPWDDEAPCDDPSQPLGTDTAVMKELLLRNYKRTGGGKIMTICGFNPWQRKYTDSNSAHNHGGVAAEWRYTEIVSAYNYVKDADAAGYCGLSNASVYTHFPLKERYPNPPAKKAEYDKNKTYIMFYVGDYDASAWTNIHVAKFAHDPALGRNPLYWCFNPNLSDRVPHAFDYMRTRYTGSDYFGAGDSGAGYLNPALLYAPRVHSDLPDGDKVFAEHNRKYYEKFDISSCGFIINGEYPTDERQMKLYASFSPLGNAYNGYGQPSRIVDGTPFIPHTWDIGVQDVPAEQAVRAALDGIDRCPKEKRFHIFRTILVSPTRHDEIYRGLKAARPEANFELVDPYNFFAFLKRAIEDGTTY